MVPSIAIYHKQFNQISVICLQTVKWWNSSISNNSILYKAMKVYGSKYCHVSRTIPVLFLKFNLA